MEESLQSIRSVILDRIKPTKEENQQINSVISEITSFLSNWNDTHDKISYEFITAQGSTGIKQTHLRNDSDIDLFIFLNPENYRSIIETGSKNREKISKLFRQYCDTWIIPALQDKKVEDIYIAYAEHPYVSSKLKGYDIDIVFSFILSEEHLQKRGPITAVDRTYYHSKFIKEHLNEKQIDDVRILKHFFKSNFSYGDKAPIARGGFIGYAAELWIYHYGDIWTFFRNFANLPFIGIDFFNRSTQELRKISRFKNDVLLLIDPTDKNRNVASSISERAWIYCAKKIDDFLKNPKNSQIFEASQDDLDLTDKSLNQNFVVIEIEQTSDSHYTKIRDKLYSVAESLKSIASKEPIDQSTRFQDVNYAIYFTPDNKRFSIAFYTSNIHLSEKYLRNGPKVSQERNFQKFKEKHPYLIVKNGISYVEETRKFTNFIELINYEFRKRLFKEIDLVNISIPADANFPESSMSIYVLKNCVIPYQDELVRILQKTILKKKRKKR